MVDGMSDQPFSTSAEARRNRRHASWMLSLLLVPDGSSSSSLAGGAVADGGSEDPANLAGKATLAKFRVHRWMCWFLGHMLC